MEHLQDSTDRLSLHAILVLKALAENAPAAFNVHLDNLDVIGSIWNGLTGKKLDLRRASTQALQVGCSTEINASIPHS